MRIGIVGAGASGVLTAVHLARRWTDQSRPHVTVYDEAARVARGAAYSTENPRHLLNVPAGRMSALADDPYHFVRWLRRRDPTATPEDYRPRLEFGDYLAHCLAQHARDIGLAVRHAGVRDLERVGDEWHVHHARGTDVADAVVLAMGHAAPAGLPVLEPSQRYVPDPWAPGALELLLRTTAPGDVVLAVGTGLTAVDVALSIVPHGRRLVAVSRRGLMPAAQRDTMPTAVPLSLPAAASMTAAEVERLVIRHVADVTATGEDWRAAIDGVRPVTAELWRRMPLEERATFLTGAARRWEVVRHRMAPEVARCLDSWRETERFESQLGEVVAAVVDADRVRLTLRRGDGGLEGVEAAAVVNCTGPTCDINGYALGRKLRERGLVQPDPLGLGIAVGPVGAAVDAAGRPDPTVGVVGPLRRGAVYESTAIPEIRGQAAQVATALSAVAALRA